MEIVLVAVGLVVFVLVVIRVAVGFLRWTRVNASSAGQWAVGTYLRQSIGDWVDRTNDSHHGHSIDGNHHHGAHAEYHSHHGAHHHSDAGYHGGGDGGHDGGF